jgi:hypothetical protein
VSISDVAVTEGNIAPVTMTFTVGLVGSQRVSDHRPLRLCREEAWVRVRLADGRDLSIPTRPGTDNVGRLPAIGVGLFEYVEIIVPGVTRSALLRDVRITLQTPVAAGYSASPADSCIRTRSVPTWRCGPVRRPTS